jgi:hypothetical protein
MDRLSLPPAITRAARWLAFAGICLVILSLAKDTVVKTVATAAASRLLGTQVTMRRCSLGLLNQRLLITGLIVAQPDGFDAGTLLDVPKVSVRLHVPALFQGRLHVPDATIDVREFVLIKQASGQLNVDALKVVTEVKNRPPVPAASGGPQTPTPFLIEALHLHVGRVVFKDYHKGTPPDIRVYEHVLPRKTFKRITDAGDFVLLVLMQAMSPTAIKGAGVYGAAALSGVGLLPAAVLGVMVARDDASTEFAKDRKAMLALFEAFLKEAGKVTRTDPARGELWAKVRGHDVYVRVEEAGRRRSRVRVTARQFLLPKPATAAGLLYQFAEQLSAK